MNTLDRSLNEDQSTTFTPDDLYQNSQGLEERAHLIVLNGSSMGKLYLVTENLLLGRSSEAAVQLRDYGISRRHCRISLESGMPVLQDLGSRNGTFLNGQRIQKETLKEGDKIRIGLITLKFVFLDELEEFHAQRMADSAMLDSLTGIYNRRYFLSQLEIEIYYAIRHGFPLSLLLVDLDQFKQINDNYGHLVGDEILIRFAELIKQNIRDEDLFCRYGGDEFIIMVRGTNLSQAVIFAERLRSEVAKLSINLIDESTHLTVSIGAASLPNSVSSVDPMDLIAASDAALYRAKHRGRNCVAV
jgi:diguanylate cyclase (GGDEF)-like protein